MMEMGKLYKVAAGWTARPAIAYAVKHHGHLWVRLVRTEDEDHLSLYKSIATGSRHAFYEYEMDAADENEEG